MKKLYALGYGELLMFSRDEERGAFEFHAGVEEGLWTLSKLESGDLGFRMIIEGLVVQVHMCAVVELYLIALSQP